MMENIIQFIVNDTSPTISYQSSSTATSQNGTTAWAPCFADIGCAPFFQEGRVPQGVSSHITYQDNASLTVSWRGTGVQLLGNVSGYPHIYYTIHLDGLRVFPQPDQPRQVLALFHDLELQDHNITLTVNNPGSTVNNTLVFKGAKITVNDTTAGATVPFNDTNVIYDGSWTPNTSDLGQFQVSTTVGDKARTSFQGTSILLYGRTSPSAGEYTVSLAPSGVNSTANSTFSAQTPFTNPHALLFYAFDLDPTINYTLLVTNEGGGELFVRTDGFQVYESGGPTVVPSDPPTSTSAPTSRISKSTIAAATLAAFLFSFLILLLLFYVVVYRPRSRRCRAEFDTLKADNEAIQRRGNPIAQLEEASKSQTSSYRRRLARIISMINAPEQKRPSWKNEIQQLSPISPTSTHKSDLILDIRRDTKDDSYLDQVNVSEQPVTEEGETIMVHAPFESEPLKSHDLGGASGHLQVPTRSSPNATIPVSPSISSVGNTQSRNNSSQASSWSPRSNRFSLPFSLSIPYVRSRSRTEDGTRSNSAASRGIFRRRWSHMAPDNQDQVDNNADEEDSNKSMSAIVFAEAKDKSPTSGEPRVRTGVSIAKEEPVKGWGFREELGRSLRSLMWRMSGTGRGGHAVHGENVIYPFVGISSTSRPGRLLSGGGLIVLERGQGEAEAVAGDIEQLTPPQEQSPNSPGTDAETDITPLSYGTQSDVSAAIPDAHNAGATTEEAQTSVADANADNDTIPFPPTYPFSAHPYAAAALASESEERIPAGHTPENRPAAPLVGASQLPRRQAAPPASRYRRLPAIPRIPPAAASALSGIPPQDIIRPVSDNITTVPAGGRALRALPPLPIASGTNTVAKGPGGSGEPSREAPVPQKSSLPRIADEDEKEDDDTSSSSPQGAESPENGQHTHEDAEGTPVPDFLSVRRVSPFRVNFPYTDDEQGLDEKSNSPRERDTLLEKKGTPSRPKLPSLRIGSTGSSLQPPALTPRTSRSTAQQSFLDFTTSSSSSNRDGSSREKSETSSASELGLLGAGRVLDERTAEEDDDRRTFGQRGGRSSFYYNSGDMPPPSPSSSQWTHQSHQTYQSQSQEVQRPSSWSQYRRRHASWRTFGSRIERDIPEEAFPPETSDATMEVPTQAPLETLMEVSPVEQRTSTAHQNRPPLPPLVKEGTEEELNEPARAAREGRTSYMSTSSGGHAHIHPLAHVSFNLNQPHPYSFQPASLRASQIEPPSPLTDEMSASPMQFRTGALRRTSSGDVQPITHGRLNRHNHNGGSSSSGSGSEPRPPPSSQHPFSIP